MVISPAPNLQEVVKAVTERTIESWHIERGLAVPEYSYCLYDRNTEDEFGLQQLHMKVKDH